MAKVVRRGEATAERMFGYSVHLDVAGLQPGRPYWYRFQSGDATSAVGRAITLPAPGTALDRPALRLCVLLQLRARLFFRLPASHRRKSAIHHFPRRLHLRNHRREPADRAPAFRWRRSRDAADLSQPLCAIPIRPGPATPARAGAGACHLGRSRSAKRLRRQILGIFRRSGAVPDQARGGLSGVLRAYAGAADPVASERPADAGLRSLHLRRSHRNLGHRRPAIPLARGLLRPAEQGRRPSGKQWRLSGTARCRAHHDGLRSGSLALFRARAQQGAMEFDRAGCADGAVAGEAGRHRRASGPTIGTAIRRTARGCSSASTTPKCPIPWSPRAISIPSLPTTCTSIPTIRPRRSSQPNSSARRSHPTVRPTTCSPRRCRTIRMFISSRAGGAATSWSISNARAMNVRMRVVSDAHDPKADISTLKTYAVESGRPAW